MQKHLFFKNISQICGFFSLQLNAALPRLLGLAVLGIRRTVRYSVFA